MSKYVAFLRAVNVGGTGRLAMADLRRMCAEIGFRNVQTYIASGNVAFESDATAKIAKASLEKKLAAYTGKPIGVILRTSTELQRVLKNNPFSECQPGRLRSF